MNSKKAQNGCLNYAFKWEALEDLKEVHFLKKSVLPSEDLSLTISQRHQEGLTRKIY